MNPITRALMLFPLAFVLGCEHSAFAPDPGSTGASPTFAKGGNGKGGGKPGGEEPPPTEADPAIAFVQNTDLMVMNADGSNQTTVFDAGEVWYEPSWSPDGTQLVFGSDIQGGGVFKIDVDGTNLQNVVAPVVASTGGGFARPVWSPVPAPDGRFKIAYADLPGEPDGTPEGDHYDLFLVNIDGTGRVNLTNTPTLHELSPTWSPAGRLAADAGVTGGILVYNLGLTGQGEVTISGQTNITDTGPLSAAYRVFRPAWSKTPDKIAVVVFETGQSFRDIWVIDLGNPGTPSNVTLSPDVSENMPSWSPDDLQIAFVRSNGKKARGVSIFTMNADGSDVTEIGNAKRGVLQRSPDWRRNQ